MKIEEFNEILHAGIDESGKGDVFGSLIIAGVVVSPEQCPLLIEKNIRDSKIISAGVIKKLASFLEDTLIYDIVVIRPQKYNELYSKMRNINKILGWGHQTVIKNLYKKKSFKYAVSDKFSKKNRINISKINVELFEFEKGERDIAVASASILARAKFLKEMDMMSEKYHLNFPKGAGPQIAPALINFVNTYGKKRLNEVAKINFKNVRQYE